MFAAVIALTAALAGGYLGVVEGFILNALLVGAILLMVQWSKEAPEMLESADDDADAAFDRVERGGARDALELSRWRRLVGREILIGLAALAITLVAADLLLDGVVGLGERFGLPIVVLGLITGVGTSLPELAAGIAGARHGHSDLVIGNVVGSNVFNSLGVAGLAAIVGPGSVAGITTAALLVMVGAAFIAGIFSFTGRAITRVEGSVLLVLFVLFVVFTFQ
jgi:cation:H+ antiporter